MRIVVAISGGIAAYKAPLLVRLLKAQGHDVRCATTPHALQFVTKATLETVSGAPLYYDLFNSSNSHSTEHISLKDWAQLVIVAPATANIIGKMACGIADDAVSTLLLSASHKPLFVCPAMNDDMWRNPALQRNIDLLRQAGVILFGPEQGELACGSSGIGRMVEPEEIVRRLSFYIDDDGNFARPPKLDIRVLITAGPTYERIDPVRFIGNYSSGKMGLAIANTLALYGAKVELVAGPIGNSLHCDPLIHRTDVESANEMYEAAMAAFPSCDAAILTAAVADYRPMNQADQKIKKTGDDGLCIQLVQNPDILASLGRIKTSRQKLIGFALETNNEFSNAQAKLEKKNLDYIVLNSLRDKGAGFAVDTNKVTIISRDGSSWSSPLKTKQAIAKDIVTRCLMTS